MAVVAALDLVLHVVVPEAPSSSSTVSEGSTVAAFAAAGKPAASMAFGRMDWRAKVAVEVSGPACGDLLSDLGATLVSGRSFFCCCCCCCLKVLKVGFSFSSGLLLLLAEDFLSAPLALLP